MAGILSSIVVGYFVAGALGKTGVIDDNGAHQCDWNPAGPLNPHLSKRACSLPFSENRASTVSSWRPWTHRPVCTSAKTKSRYCAFVKDDFRGESSILILTSPEVAAGDLSFVDDFDTQWLESGPLFPLPETAPYEVKEMAGKGFGIVVNSTIPAGNVIMREYPAILQTTSTELSGKIDAGEALWVLEEGFIRLPTKDQLKVFNLARSTGGHVLEDTIRTNTFGVTFNNASHYGLFPGVAVRLFCCQRAYNLTNTRIEN
ncbi:uncharacterized protein CTRU02_211140 [Colletotrichum truncatum]|uniref:Uncharacterized protein n=1 Tax=Colletotrichum truncatum TaxID=5467 RepID=A0ACC3YSB1_COLTU